MQIINCKNCGKKMSRNIPNCPHCGFQTRSVILEPCRICGTLLESKSHRWHTTGYYTVMRNGNSETDTYIATHHASCPECGDPEPLRRFFIDTGIGKFISHPLAFAIAIFASKIAGESIHRHLSSWHGWSWREVVIAVSTFFIVLAAIGLPMSTRKGSIILTNKGLRRSMASKRLIQLATLLASWTGIIYLVSWISGCLFCGSNILISFVISFFVSLKYYILLALSHISF